MRTDRRGRKVRTLSLGTILLSLLAAGQATAAPLDYDRRTAIVEVVEKVSPSVIAIKTDVRKTVAVNPFEGMWFGMRGFRDRYVQERVFSSAGSGIIVDPQGIVVTNAHVIANANRLTGTTQDGQTHGLTLVGVDPNFDVAILQIEDEGGSWGKASYSGIDWGTTSDLMMGETVVVIGSALAFENSVSTGIVSAVERTIKVATRERPYFGMIQTDAAINRGNSGGPLVNIRGELIGVTTLIATEGGGSDGIGFAIPIERVQQVHNEFVKGLVSLEEQLGIRYVSQKLIENIDSSQAQRLGLKQARVEGLIAVDLDESGEASQAGLRQGDLLIEVNGRKVRNLPEYQRALEAHNWNEALAITFLRYNPKNEKVDQQTIKIDTNPLQGGEIEREDSWLGFAVEGINNDFADEKRVSIDDGVVVRSVEKGSPAFRAEIKPGDLVIAINRYPVQTIGDFRRLRYTEQNEDRVYVRVRRGRDVGDIEITRHPGPRGQGL